MKKKIFAILLATISVFVLCFSLTACDGGAKAPSDGLAYTLSNDGTHYIVSGIGSCKDTKVVIPSTYNDLPVTSIGDSAFVRCTFKSITIPNSVTTIGDSAFAFCTSLTSITIPDSVTNIGLWAFSDCSSLASVTMGNGLTVISTQIFENCTSLKNVTIGSGANSIGWGVFQNCSSLTSITYNGTISQWEAISLGEYWNTYTGDYTIHCSNGDISKL